MHVYWPFGTCFMKLLIQFSFSFFIVVFENLVMVDLSEFIYVEYESFVNIFFQFVVFLLIFFMLCCGE
jgi:hypothetical protein